MQFVCSIQKRIQCNKKLVTTIKFKYTDKPYCWADNDMRDMLIQQGWMEGKFMHFASTIIFLANINKSFWQTNDRVSSLVRSCSIVNAQGVKFISRGCCSSISLQFLHLFILFSHIRWVSGHEMAKRLVVQRYNNNVNVEKM